MEQKLIPLSDIMNMSKGQLEDAQQLVNNQLTSVRIEMATEKLERQNRVIDLKRRHVCLEAEIAKKTVEAETAFAAQRSSGKDVSTKEIVKLRKKLEAVVKAGKKKKLADVNMSETAAIGLGFLDMIMILNSSGGNGYFDDRNFKRTLPEWQEKKKLELEIQQSERYQYDRDELSTNGKLLKELEARKELIQDRIYDLR